MECGLMSDKAVEGGAQTVKLQFHYIKGPWYHEIAGHGVIGGPTPAGKIWMAIYSERAPLPRMVEYDVAPPEPGSTTIQFEEHVAIPSNRETRNGVIRHIECGVYMDLEVAERIRDWLTRHIEQLKAENNEDRI